MKTILVIEDEPVIRSNLIEMLEAEGFRVLGVEDGTQGIDVAVSERPDLVICDIMLPDDVDGFTVLRRLREHPRTVTRPFIFLTAKADRADVRLGMTLGADDYLTKPFTRGELLDSIHSRLARYESHASARAPTADREPDASSPADGASLVVCDKAMQALYEQAFRAARSPISVLLLGETGVGKEVLANEIHRRSPRAKAPFLALNCAALPEALLESELFGNEKGAFTGAMTARPGLFESAHGGTVFLDEVGDLPMATQVKLLRVIEDRKVMRVGARTPTSIDIRFISATNRDLEADIAKGTFRQDLFFRLNGIAFTILPLRRRTIEIPHLARTFLAHEWRELDRADAPTISEQAMVCLLEYSWPGNIRELRSVIRRAVVLCTDNVLLPEHLPDKLVAAEPPEPSSLEDRLRAEMDAAERRAIVDALERCGGNQTQAAAMLGVSRRTLVKRIAVYDLPRPRKR